MVNFSRSGDTSRKSLTCVLVGQLRVRLLLLWQALVNLRGCGGMGALLRGKGCVKRGSAVQISDHAFCTGWVVIDNAIFAFVAGVNNPALGNGNQRTCAFHHASMLSVLFGGNHGIHDFTVKAVFPHSQNPLVQSKKGGLGMHAALPRASQRQKACPASGAPAALCSSPALLWWGPILQGPPSQRTCVMGLEVNLGIPACCCPNHLVEVT